MDNQHLTDLLYALAVSTPSGKTNNPWFAARDGGLFRSDDNGQTWQDAYKTLLDGQSMATYSLAISPNFEQNPMVFAGVSGGVVRSRDGGRTWRTAIFPPPAPLLRVGFLIKRAKAQGKTFQAAIFSG